MKVMRRMKIWNQKKVNKGMSQKLLMKRGEDKISYKKIGHCNY